jgi:hypothetical protein
MANSTESMGTSQWYDQQNFVSATELMNDDRRFIPLIWPILMPYDGHHYST